MQWWFAHQPSLLGYIFENVPMLGYFLNKVLECQHYVWKHLGNFVDAVSFGSSSHRYPL
jgi:hypothetical protein